MHIFIETSVYSETIEEHTRSVLNKTVVIPVGTKVYKIENKPGKFTQWMVCDNKALFSIPGKDTAVAFIRLYVPDSKVKPI